MRAKDPENYDRQKTLNEDSLICFECIVEPFLAEEIRRDGNVGLCDWCEEERQTLFIADIANVIRPIYEVTVRPVFSEEPVPDTFAPPEIVEEMLACDFGLAAAILNEMRAKSLEPEQDEEYLYDLT